MAIQKIIYKQKISDTDYDDLYFKTSADMVMYTTDSGTEETTRAVLESVLAGLKITILEEGD